MKLQKGKGRRISYLDEDAKDGVRATRLGVHLGAADLSLLVPLSEEVH